MYACTYDTYTNECLQEHEWCASNSICRFPWDRYTYSYVLVRTTSSSSFSYTAGLGKDSTPAKGKFEAEAHINLYILIPKVRLYDYVHVPCTFVYMSVFRLTPINKWHLRPVGSVRLARRTSNCRLQMLKDINQPVEAAATTTASLSLGPLCYSYNQYATFCAI